MGKNYFKIVCIDESDPFEYKVLEDANRSTIDEVHEFVKEKLPLHDGAKWILLSGTINM